MNSDRPLYLISEGSLLSAPEKLFSVINKILDAHGNKIWAVQLRSENGQIVLDNKFLERIYEKTSSLGVKLIANESVKIFDKFIDGVHLKSNNIEGVKRLRAEKAESIIGYSAHTIEEVKLAKEYSASYIFFSPIFTPISKPLPKNILLQGVDALISAVNIAAPMPVFALGGVTSENANICNQSGAKGVAVIGSVFQANDSVLAVHSIISSWDKATN